MALIILFSEMFEIFRRKKINLKENKESDGIFGNIYHLLKWNPQI
jgi:hypothetical protein